jgi:predicted amidohydrolase
MSWGAGNVLNIKELNERAVKGKKAETEQRHQRARLLLAFDAVFNNPQGKIVLEYLKTHTVDTPAWNPVAAPSGEQAIYHAFVREGQNSLYREIEKLAKNGLSYRNSPAHDPAELDDD